MAEVGRALVAAGLLCIVGVRPLQSQSNHEQPALRSTVKAVLAGNIIAGGVVASTHALLARRNPFKAFALGAFGGAIHGFGKVVGSGLDSVGLFTNSVSGFGTSIVYNAGRGASILEEFFVPFGPIRMRVYPNSDDVVRFTVNAQELVVLAGAYGNDQRRFDHRGTLAAGTFLFNSAVPLHGPAGQASGQANTSIITIGPNAPIPEQTFRHEVVHVQQHWFMVETIDRPIEAALRPKIPGIRRLPEWIELGVVSTMIYHAERRIFGSNGPYRRLREIEAETLESPGDLDGGVGLPGTFTLRGRGP